MGFDFSLVDVFTDRPFGGNQLAVFPDAAGIAAVGAVIMVAGLALLRTGAAPGCGRGLAGARPARQRPRHGYGPRPRGRSPCWPDHGATRPPGRRGAVYRA